MKPENPHPKKLLKSDQAAAYLGISARKLWQLTHEKRIPAVKFDRVLRYDIADLDAFILKMKEVLP